MEVGTVIDGKYRVEKELGRGSFGGVYKAKQLNFDRLVAIKLLQPRGKTDEEMRQRFKREAKLSSHLNSQHSIRIYDFGETDGRMFIVMEYLEGMPLDKLLRESGPMPAERVTNIVEQVLDSLVEAHKLGIVHRDLKPDNIFICNNATQTDFVKVFDFGIAKVVGGGGGGSLKETAKLTMIGGTVGTPAYMSPEQCCGEPLTPSSDLYSLGIVMYELLTGDLPFEDSNPVRTMMKQINDPPPDLAPHLANKTVAKVMRKALAKGVTDRYESAEAMLAALEEGQAAQDEPTIALNSKDLDMRLDGGEPTIVDPLPQGLMMPTPTDPGPSSMDTKLPPPPSPPKKRSTNIKLIIAIFVAGFFLLLLAIVFLVLLLKII